MKTQTKLMAVLSVFMIAAFLLSACQPQTVEVVKTVEVEKVVTQEVVQTQVVEVEKPSFSTPHPILSDVRVRQAIAYCTNRPELIASVYPWLPEEKQSELLMDEMIV